MYYCGDGRGTVSRLGFKVEFSSYDERFQQVYEMLEIISCKVRKREHKPLWKAARNLVYSKTNTF